MLKLVILFVALIVVLINGNSIEGNFEQCSFQCSNNGAGDAPISTNRQSTHNLLRGKSGPRGPKGDQGQEGKKCDVTEITKLQSRISELESDDIRQKNASQENISRLERNLDLVTGKLNASQDEISHLKEYVTTINEQMNTSQGHMKRNLGFVTGQLNDTLYELVANLKSELASLNETFVEEKHTKTLEESVIEGSSCKQLIDDGYDENGVYTITAGVTSFQTYCDMDAGGFIVFQRRFDGSTDFYQNFQTYINGFGNVNAEYWLGLEKLHQLTRSGRYQLRVDLQAYDNDEAYATYDDFSIGAAPGYQLNVGTYSGTAGDSLKYHNGMSFSTYDKDVSGDNCVGQWSGAWWYKHCHHSNLNAFVYAEKRSYKGMAWQAFKSGGNPMKTTKMSFREI